MQTELISLIKRNNRKCFITRGLHNFECHLEAFTVSHAWSPVVTRACHAWFPVVAKAYHAWYPVVTGACLKLVLKQLPGSNIVSLSGILLGLLLPSSCWNCLFGHIVSSSVRNLYVFWDFRFVLKVFYDGFAYVQEIISYLLPS